MAALRDIVGLDWDDEAIEFPDGFQPLDAIVLVKGVYETDDGSLTKPVWCHRWTTALARSVHERVGALDVGRRLAVQEALAQYDPLDDDE